MFSNFLQLYQFLSHCFIICYFIFISFYHCCSHFFPHNAVLMSYIAKANYIWLIFACIWYQYFYYIIFLSISLSLPMLMFYMYLIKAYYQILVLVQIELSSLNQQIQSIYIYCDNSYNLIYFYQIFLCYLLFFFFTLYHWIGGVVFISIFIKWLS